MTDLLEPLEDYLDQLCREGQFNSVGRFSLDSRQAISKLAAFRLASPYEYILKLVQAAVSSGATELSIRVGFRDITVLWDSPLDQVQVAELHHLLLRPEKAAPRSLNHLAVAFEALHALEPKSVELISWPGQPGHGVCWRRSGTQVEVAEILSDGNPLPRTRVRIVGRKGPRLRPSSISWAGWLEDLLTRSLGDYGAEFRAAVDSEYSQVWRRCLLAPIPILLNGRAINRPYFGLPRSHTRMDSERRLDVRLSPRNQFSSQIYLAQSGQSNRGIPGPRALTPQTSWIAAQGLLTQSAVRLMLHPSGFPVLDKLTVEGQACYSCSAVLGRRTGLFPSPGFTAYLLDGVVLSKTWNQTQAFRDWCLLINAEEMSTDLSGFGLVENGGHSALLHNLDRAIKLSL